MRVVTSYQINTIINAFRENNTVCLPTDTIRAFSCSALNQRCIEQIFNIKQRDKKQTLPIFMKDLNMLFKYAYLTNMEERFANSVWPGAVTFVVRSKVNKLPSLLVRNGKIAVRVPANILIKEICSSINGPIVATSANLSGQKTIVNATEIAAEMVTQLDLFIQSYQQLSEKDQQSSTIIEFVNNRINVLRQGRVKL